jgi:hypothetical protein
VSDLGRTMAVVGGRVVWTWEDGEVLRVSAEDEGI